jgi:D-glycero-D-manno-heptose 1,7-bisphosphate phosphatase
MNSRAAFLDRDGTIIEERSFLRDPEEVRLLDGAAQAIIALRQAEYRVIVVTNQSGIGRGLLTWGEYRAVAARLDALLGQAGAPVDATYLCPHHPEFTGPCDCRKPGLQLYRDAERDWSIDLGRSILVGDQLRDVVPAAAFGARGFLIGGPDPGPGPWPPGVELVADLAEAARRATAR